MFRDEIRHLSKIMNLAVVEILSSPGPGWTGVCGRLDRTTLEWVLETRSRLRSPSVFVCGPPKMMAGARTALTEIGIEDRNIHTEDVAMV